MKTRTKYRAGFLVFIAGVSSCEYTESNMVKKLLALFNRDWSNLHEAAILIGFFALVSQVLALVRDRLLAHSFGASQTLDIYYAAFRIPDFIFVSVASFMSALVLIPLLTQRASESDARAHKFLNDVFTVFFLLLVIVGVGVFFAIPWLAHTFFPQFNNEASHEFILTTRILLLSPIFFGLSNLLGSVTQMLNRFFALALAPLVYNLGIIAGVVFFYPAWGIGGLGFGVALGAFLHFFINFVVSSRSGFPPLISLKISFSDIWEVFKISLPRTLALSANQIALFALTVLATRLEAGALAVFTFAFNLQAVPLTVVGVSYATAAFPSLAKHFTEDEIDKFLAQILSATRLIVFWSLPVIVLAIVLRAQVVRTVLGSGLFDWTATKLTAAALALFVISVAAQSLTLLFARGFYAAGKTFVPFVVNVCASLVIVGGGVGLLYLFDHYLMFRYFIESLLRVSDVSGTDILMLPLAYSIGISLNALLLMYLFRKQFGKFLSPLKETLFHGLSASLLAGFVAYEFLEVVGLYQKLDSLPGVLLQGALGGIAGVLTWWLVLELLGNTEVREVRRSLTHKFWRVGTIIPDREEL